MSYFVLPGRPVVYYVSFGRLIASVGEERAVF